MQKIYATLNAQLLLLLLGRFSSSKSRKPSSSQTRIAAMSESPVGSSSSRDESPATTASPTDSTFSMDESPDMAFSPASSTFSLEERPRKSSYQAPGRIGDKHMKLFQDPRAHPKLVETFRAFGMDGSQPNPFAHMKEDDLSSMGQMAQNHVDTATMYEMLPNDLPEDELEPKVERTTVKFTSFDGAERNLYIFRPAGVEGPLPAVMYTASAVTILDTANKVHHIHSISNPSHTNKTPGPLPLVHLPRRRRPNSNCRRLPLSLGKGSPQPLPHRPQ